MLVVENLVHRFDDEPAIDGLSLTINDGEWVVIAGPNGSGKTTLVRHFNALLTPDEGSVKIDGQSVSENPITARTKVGMVFQSPRDQFVAATVGEDIAFGPENLGLPREEIDRRVTESLAAVNLDGRETEYIASLSGGEQSRVAIAGALAMKPAHLVLDEPFTGLDWPAQRSVLDHLDSLNEAGTSIIVVTHDVRDMLSRADSVVGLRDGRIAFDLPPENAREELNALDVRTP